jgi:NarL family two-component system response regulator LiaR
MIRVLIADDHKIVRQGLRFLLSQEPGIEVAGEAADGGAALEAVRFRAAGQPGVQFGSGRGRGRTGAGDGYGGGGVGAAGCILGGIPRS